MPASQTKVTRIRDAENRRLRYRGWSRLLLHAATISAVEAVRATAPDSVASAAVGKEQRESMGSLGTDVATVTSMSDRTSRQASRASREAVRLQARPEEAKRDRQGNASRRLGRLVRTPLSFLWEL